MKIAYFLAICLFLLTKQSVLSNPLNNKWLKNEIVDSVYYDIYIPPNFQNKCLLVFPGWNYSRKSWIKNTKLIHFSNQFGYALILPEMGKTLYESSYFPETYLKWHSIPGGVFIKKVFIPHIQKKHNLLTPKQFNALLGLSTGGRGVVLTALENPGLFSAAASLSGDYAQELYPKDNLITAIYGRYSEFPDRWHNIDNPMYRAQEWKISLYLAHGLKDKVVPEIQSSTFYKKLKNLHKNNIKIIYNVVPHGKHNYQFWNGELKPIFSFFESIQAGSL